MEARRFPRVYFLHGMGGSPDGTVRTLKHAIVPLTTAGYTFMRPTLPHGRAGLPAEESLYKLHGDDLPHGSLLIGISMGGLVAAKLQELGRPDLSVIAISAPTWADDVNLESRCTRRFSIYSSRDDVLKGRTSGWPTLADAYDVSTLTHDTDSHMSQLAPAIAAYLNGYDPREAFGQLLGTSAL